MAVINYNHCMPSTTNEHHQMVPPQHTGKPIDAKTSLEVLPMEEAKAFFDLAKTRLQRVSAWHTLAGKLLAEFSLMDPEGNAVDREPQPGDYLRIDIPGPGSPSAGGYDWVRVEEVENKHDGDTETYGFRVRPAQAPKSSSAPGEVAHFYAPEATSTFLVSRNGSQLRAEIFDRNIKPNNDSDSAVDKLRDSVVGAFGAAAFSKIQWQRLTEGLLAEDDQ